MGKKPVAMGLGPPFVIAQLPEPPPNIRGQAGFGSAHTEGLHLPWAESSADSLIGQILLRPTPHSSHLTPAGLVHCIPHQGSQVCDAPILLLGALPQPPPLCSTPRSRVIRDQGTENTGLYFLSEHNGYMGWGGWGGQAVLRQAGLGKQGAQAISPGSGSIRLFPLRLGFVVGPARSQ